MPYLQPVKSFVNYFLSFKSTPSSRGWEMMVLSMLGEPSSGMATLSTSTTQPTGPSQWVRKGLPQQVRGEPATIQMYFIPFHIVPSYRWQLRSFSCTEVWWDWRCGGSGGWVQDATCWGSPTPIVACYGGARDVWSQKVRIYCIIAS